jgi:hypothetical protein
MSARATREPTPCRPLKRAGGGHVGRRPSRLWRWYHLRPSRNHVVQTFPNARGKGRPLGLSEALDHASVPLTNELGQGATSNEMCRYLALRGWRMLGSASSRLHC